MIRTKLHSNNILAPCGEDPPWPCRYSLTHSLYIHLNKALWSDVHQLHTSRSSFQKSPHCQQCSTRCHNCDTSGWPVSCSVCTAYHNPSSLWLPPPMRVSR